MQLYFHIYLKFNPTSKESYKIISPQPGFVSPVCRPAVVSGRDSVVVAWPVVEERYWS